MGTIVSVIASDVVGGVGTADTGRAGIVRARISVIAWNRITSWSAATLRTGISHGAGILVVAWLGVWYMLAACGGIAPIVRASFAIVARYGFFT